MKRVSIVFALILLAAPMRAGERLKVHISHVDRLGPANVLVQTIVEPAAANRALQVVAESADFYRSSTVQLDGSKSPRAKSFWLEALPSGEYVVSVRVLANDGTEVAIEREYLVIG